MATTSDTFDVVVAGAGHNSLVATAYLVKAGYRCLVLEGRPVVGGAVKTQELTLRGFNHDVCSAAHSTILSNPMFQNNEINLREYGLEYIEPDPVIHMPFPDGSWLTQWRDLDRTCAEFAKFSKKDAAAYRRMLAEFEKVRPIFEAVAFTPIGFGEPLNDRLAEVPNGHLWQRRAAMSQWDIIRDNFEDDHCRAFLLASPFTHQPPQYPMTGRLAYASIRTTPRCIPKGGSGVLTQALARYIEAHGGVVLVNKGVAQLIVEQGTCTGVECADGSQYRAAKAVLSTIHIKQLVDMAPHELWGEDFLYGVETWQPEISAVVAHYATTEAPRFQSDGGPFEPVETCVMPSSDRALGFIYDHLLGRVNLENPPLEITCCSTVDPTRAPAGMHTVRLLGFHPYEIKQGHEHWDELKDKVAESNLNYMRCFAPNLTEDKILARFVESPVDLERMNPHNWHGSYHAGAADASQSGALRPMAGWAQHRMPIKGLYQTGATTHPGGSVTGAPGRNAATVMLKDFGTSIEAIVSGKS
ncbi:MAG: NAD(P)/FAD-dependent oxidoreductase [Terriglobales bacterium]|jgi:phytoene dehydrogenase-like protein